MSSPPLPTSTSPTPPCTILITPTYTLSLSLRPSTPLQLTLTLPCPLCTLPREEFVGLLCAVRRLARVLRQGEGWGYERVRRFGLASDGGSDVALIPMHGLEETWKPVLSYGDDLPTTTDAGTTAFPHLSTATTPHAAASDLSLLSHAIRSVSGLDPSAASPLIPGPHPADNLFARLIRGELPVWRTHDAPDYCAWLTPFPPARARGATVVVPRGWAKSNVLGIERGRFEEYMGWTWDVARDVVCAFGRAVGEDLPRVSAHETAEQGEGRAVDSPAPTDDTTATPTLRTFQSPTERVVGFALFFEGFEIDWAHTKIYPVWTEREAPPGAVDTAASASERDTPAEPHDAAAYYTARSAALASNDDATVAAPFYTTYPGHLSTRPGPRVSAAREAELAALAGRMRAGVEKGMRAEVGGEGEGKGQ